MIASATKLPALRLPYRPKADFGKNMNIPPEIRTWLVDSVQNTTWAGVREQRAQSHTWRRQMGGRNMSAGITVSVRPSVRFELVVNSPETHPDLINGAKNGVISVLMSLGPRPVLSCSISLSEFVEIADESSYGAFYMAAREATVMVLGADENSNISW